MRSIFSLFFLFQIFNSHFVLLYLIECESNSTRYSNENILQMNLRICRCKKKEENNEKRNQTINEHTHLHTNTAENTRTIQNIRERKNTHTSIVNDDVKSFSSDQK